MHTKGVYSAVCLQAYGSVVTLKALFAWLTSYEFCNILCAKYARSTEFAVARSAPPTLQVAGDSLLKLGPLHYSHAVVQGFVNQSESGH